VQRSSETTISTPEPVWDCVDAGRFLRLHPKTVKRMARNGQIPGCQLGRKWYFRPSELDEFPRTGVIFHRKTNGLRRNTPFEREE
jgi:excisionase family DNA binding protein